jgi:hypothetical protein
MNPRDLKIVFNSTARWFAPPSLLAYAAQNREADSGVSPIREGLPIGGWPVHASSSRQLIITPVAAVSTLGALDPPKVNARLPGPIRVFCQILVSSSIGTPKLTLGIQMKTSGSKR